MIIHISKDLMLSSNASAFARQANLEYKFVGSLAKAIQYIADPEVNVTLVMIDLQTDGFDLGEFETEFEKLEAKPNSVAYAQHVMVDLLEAANESSISQVMTRGQFHHNIAAIMQA